MKKLRLLIIEDDISVIATYMRDINSFNKTNGNLKIEETILSNKDQALEILKNSDYTFDGAIIDLDLKNSGGSDSSGNEVIKEVKTNLRFPVYVISGTTHNLDPALSEETSFFKVRDRDSGFDFIEEIVSIYNTGITKILNRKGTIERYISNIFWNHMSNSMDLWINDASRNPEQKEISLLRYTLLHMQEYIDEELEKYHPSEFYITKPIKKNLFTGDIVELYSARFLILTPSCDIVIRPDGMRNSDYILFCKIKSLSSVVKNYGILKHDTSKNNENRIRINGFFENKNQKYHFIPKAQSIEPGLIDFQEKMTIPSIEVDELLNAGKLLRLATISQPFLKDIISRYSIYYSRQGSPDFNTDEIYNSIFIKDDDNTI